MYKLIASQLKEVLSEDEKRYFQVYHEINEKYRKAPVQRAAINTVFGDPRFSEETGLCFASAFLFATNRTVLDEESLKNTELLMRMHFIQVAHQLSLDPNLLKMFTQISGISPSPSHFMPKSVLTRCGLVEEASPELVVANRKDIVLRMIYLMKSLPTVPYQGILYFVNGNELHGLGFRIERASIPPKIFLYDYQWKTPHESTDELAFYFASSAAFIIFNTGKSGTMKIGMLLYHP